MLLPSLSLALWMATAAPAPPPPARVWTIEVRDESVAAIGRVGPFLEVRERDVTIQPIDAAEGLVAVTFRLQRKPQGSADRIGRVELRNVTLFPKEELRALLKPREGDRYDAADIKAWLHSIQELYAEKGHLDFSYIPEQSFRRAERKTDLTFTFDEGKQYHVRRLSLAGAAEADDGRIRKALEPIEPGNVYRPGALSGAVEALNKLGSYRPVRIEDVRVTVRRDPGPEVFLELQLIPKDR